MVKSKIHSILFNPNSNDVGIDGIYLLFILLNDHVILL